MMPFRYLRISNLPRYKIFEICIIIFIILKLIVSLLQEREETENKKRSIHVINLVAHHFVSIHPVFRPFRRHSISHDGSRKGQGTGYHQ